MANEIKTYKIKQIEEGKYDYSTLYIDVDGIEYQIPFNKSLNFKIEQDIKIENLFTPIEK